MVSFFKHKTSEKTVYRTVTELVVNPLNVELEGRQGNMVELARKEYARLSVEVDVTVRKQESGVVLFPSEKEDMCVKLGQMRVISDMVALATGKDHIVVGAQLERFARSQQSQEQPMTSWISGLTPLWASKAS